MANEKFTIKKLQNEIQSKYGKLFCISKVAKFFRLEFNDGNTTIDKTIFLSKLDDRDFDGWMDIFEKFYAEVKSKISIDSNVATEDVTKSSFVRDGYLFVRDGSGVFKPITKVYESRQDDSTHTFCDGKYFTHFDRSTIHKDQFLFVNWIQDNGHFKFQAL